ncbi:MAG TPA: hypothetical protein VNZ03_23950 [Terriglobales bacterium]|nr:hypothetical protein [Terriglobales bacterium]
MKRLVFLSAVIAFSVGCVHRRQPEPQFVARKCPRDSLPYQAVYNGVLMNHGELCMAIDPVSNRPMGVFPVQAYNPYTETDSDQDDAEKKASKSHWWKFWAGKRIGTK